MTKAQSKYWHAMVFDTYRNLIEDDLSKSECHVLFYLLSEMSKQGKTIISTQKEIMDELKMSKATVSRAISKLTDLQYIVYNPGVFMLNPYLYYIGKHEERLLDIEFLEGRLAKKKSEIKI